MSLFSCNIVCCSASYNTFFKTTVCKYCRYSIIKTSVSIVIIAQTVLKALVTPSNKNWVFGDLLAHLQEEHTAFTAAKETAHA